MKKYTDIPLPTEANYRFSLKVHSHDPQVGGAGVVALERHAVGPFWTRLDARIHESFTKLSPKAQENWAGDAQEELVQEWFAQEIYELRR